MTQSGIIVSLDVISKIIYNGIPLETRVFREKVAHEGSELIQNLHLGLEHCGNFE